MRWAAELVSRQAVRRLAVALFAASLVTAHIVRTRAQSAEESVAAADRALADALRTADRAIARKVLSLHFSQPAHIFEAELRMIALLDDRGWANFLPGAPDCRLTFNDQFVRG